MFLLDLKHLPWCPSIWYRKSLHLIVESIVHTKSKDKHSTMPKVKPVSLDGSTLEGGGQLARVALSLAAITNTPIHIYSIRANRGSGPRRTDQTVNWKGSKSSVGRERNHNSNNNSNARSEGGLKESHLAALQWLAAQCNAYVEGAEVGSREVTFIPGDGGTYTRNSNSRKQHSGQPRAVARSELVDLPSNTITLQNPGSVWLIFQALYPFMIFESTNTNLSPSDQSQPHPQFTTITLHGGTNVSKSMSTEYVTQVFLPICQRIGLPETNISLVRRGWAGNASQIGEVRITVQRPSKTSSPSNPHFHLPAFNTTNRGKIEAIDITVLAHPENTRRQLIAQLRDLIAEELESQFGADMPAINTIVDEDSEDPRRMDILLVARTDNGWRLGRDYLGSGRTPKSQTELARMLETAARTVVRELDREIKRGGAVDEYMQDQLVVFQALAEGRSSVDGGLWNLKGSNNKRRGDDGEEEEEGECGDEEGSLHTRTVRWVCKRILGKRGVQFRTGGECLGVGFGAGGGWNVMESVEVVQEKMGGVELDDEDGI